MTIKEKFERLLEAESEKLRLENADKSIPELIPKIDKIFDLDEVQNVLNAKSIATTSSADIKKLTIEIRTLERDIAKELLSLKVNHVSVEIQDNEYIISVFSSISRPGGIPVNNTSFKYAKS